MALDREVRFTHPVVAVLEDIQGQQTSFDEVFQFAAIYKPSGSALFRLSIAVTDKNRKKTILYLQIVPDRILSVNFVQNDQSITHFGDIIRKQLGGVHDVTRLRFQLRKCGDLIQPPDFIPDCCEAEGPCAFVSIALLAAASAFTLYIPHNILPAEDCWILQQHAVDRSLTRNQQDEFARMMDITRLYYGKGGVPFKWNDHPKLPSGLMPSIVPVNNSQGCGTLQGNEAEGHVSQARSESTVAISTPSCYEPPPPYPVDEHAPRAPIAYGSESIIDGSPGDCGPMFDEEGRLASYTSITARSSKPYTICGSEDTDLIYSKTRRHADFFEASMMQAEYTQLLWGYVKDFEKRHEALKKQHNDLEKRYEDLEEQHNVMHTRQEEMEDNLGFAIAETREMAEDCDRLDKQLPDACDAWITENMDSKVEEGMNDWLHDNMESIVAGYMDDWMISNNTSTQEHIANQDKQKGNAEMRKCVEDLVNHFMANVGKKLLDAFKE